MVRTRLLAIVAYLASCAPVFAQQATDKPAFEVASVRATDPNPSNPMFIGMSADGLRLEARKSPVEMIVVTHAEKTPTEN